jgi:hypothetical protein
MKKISLAILAASLSLSSIAAFAQTSPCDLNQDGKIDSTDVQLATNMALGTASCTATIAGTNVCNVVVVQRVVNAALGGVCLTGTGAVSHYVSLNWTASVSSNVVGYKIYRATSATGSYTLLTSSPVATTSYTDSTAQAGQTYYYVATAIDSSGSESAYSPQVSTTVPTP